MEERVIVKKGHKNIKEIVSGLFYSFIKTDDGLKEIGRAFAKIIGRHYSLIYSPHPYTSEEKFATEQISSSRRDISHKLRKYAREIANEFTYKAMIKKISHYAENLDQ